MISLSEKEAYTLALLAQHKQDGKHLLDRLDGDALIVGKLVLGGNICVPKEIRDYATYLKKWARGLR